MNIKLTFRCIMVSLVSAMKLLMRDSVEGVTVLPLSILTPNSSYLQ